MIRIVVLAAIAVVALCAQASAAIYFASTSTIGRMNNDGAYRLEGGSGGSFIGWFGEQRIAGACGVAINGTHIYWGDKGHGAIGRANLDGSEPNFTFIAGASDPCGVALDGSYVYWANEGAATIGRARLDGSDVRQAFITVPELSKFEEETPKLCGVAVDGAHVFWTNWQEELVGRATLDGGEVIPDFVKTPGYGPCGVAVNGTHLFWGSRSTHIGRANVDGSDPDFDFVTALQEPCAIAVDATHLYWVTEFRRDIGRAALDGSSVTTVASNLPSASCGLAVNSLAFAPPPRPLPPPPSSPPPPPGFCKVEEIRHKRQKGEAIIAVRSPAGGGVEILTRGLSWRVLNPKENPASRQPRRWWVSIRAGSKGRAAKGINRRLAADGRAALNLRVRCSSVGTMPAIARKKMALLAVPVAPEPHRGHERQ